MAVVKEFAMECHGCPHRDEVESGKHSATPFAETPCAKCELREDSTRTIEVEPDRPVFVSGTQRAGTTPGPDGPGVHWDVPFPEEAEAEEAKLPVNVMQEFVARFLSLPADVRDVVCLRFLGLSYPEIAAKHRITSAGAEARHERAMRLFPELRELFIVKTARHNKREAAADAEVMTEKDAE